MTKPISIPALNRLVAVYRLCRMLINKGVEMVSSTEIGRMLGEEPHNIRKDISCLEEIDSTGVGYSVKNLSECICEYLKLDKQRNACVVGLGKIGKAIVAYERFSKNGYTIVAGFDSDINLLDTIKVKVPVYPTYKILDTVKEKRIELGIIAVPATVAQDIADRLIEAGVRGIVNFSPVILTSERDDVYITNMDLVNEFTMLSARMAIDDEKEIVTK